MNYPLGWIFSLSFFFLWKKDFAVYITVLYNLKHMRNILMMKIVNYEIA